MKQKHVSNMSTPKKLKSKKAATLVVTSLDLIVVERDIKDAQDKLEKLMLEREKIYDGLSEREGSSCFY